MKKILLTLVSILVFSGLAFQYAQKKYEIPTVHAVQFVTVVSADKESSVSDKEEASQFLAETVIGWTHSPAFSQKLGFGISGKKQERQNFILEFDAQNPEISQKNDEKLQKILEEKLSLYNTGSNTQFSFLFEKVVISENIPKKSLWIIAGGILGLFVGASLGELFFRPKKRKKK